MGWSCRRLRAKLTLLVGDDLPECERRAVESHLARCGVCREYLKALERSRDALREGSGIDDPLEYRTSLWPGLRGRLAAAPIRQGPSWLPVGAMVAASIAIAVVMWNRTAAVSPTARRGELNDTPWLVPGIRVVETANDDLPTDPWFVPERSVHRPAPPVRSFFLLESGRPSASWEEDEL